MANPRAALDRAIRSDNLTLLYQPIHDAVTGTPVAAEALLRQRRESGEIREAGIITAAAEEAPKPELFALDSWTMQTAFGDAAAWRGSGAHWKLNVNLSPREFEHETLVARLEALLSATGLDASRVNLEITEASYIESPKRTNEVLEELKKCGVALWLDDFGTGYSSMVHLHRFPVDGLKLPGEFVKRLESDRRSRAISAALIALAHDLGMTVIAEGVERPAQLEFLAGCGCELIQGFLFSRPAEVSELASMFGTG